MTILLCAVPGGLGAASIEALSPGDVVSTAPELSEALRLVAIACPTIIVVGGSTVQVVADSCRQLRAIDGCRDAIIVAAGADRPEDVQNLLEAGADDFFAGALDGGQLRSRLLVARRRAAELARHRATERALRELSESLGTTLNSIGDGVIATDSNGLIVRMNPVAEKLTGWDVGEAKGAPLSGILPLLNSDTRAKVENPFDHALRQGVSVALAPGTLLVRRDGGEIPIADSCAPIKSSDGRFDGAVLVFRDLTAQQATEAAHARLQQQLVFADRMASVGTLAAGVAHEINNPLGVTLILTGQWRGLREARSMTLSGRRMAWT